MVKIFLGSIPLDPPTTLCVIRAKKYLYTRAEMDKKKKLCALRAQHGRTTPSMCAHLLYVPHLFQALDPPLSRLSLKIM